jgi:ferredoxin hydrogenase large subunit/hydrogenase large subunit
VKAQLDSKMVYPAAPFLPRYTAKYLQDSDANFTALRHYLDALEMRTIGHKMAAVFAGKMPHAATLLAGGVTEQVSALKIVQYKAFLDRLRTFIDTAYLPDVAEVAKAFPEYFTVGRGCGNFLCYGVFPQTADGSRKFIPPGLLLDGKILPVEPNSITEDVTYSWFSSGSGLKPAEGQTTAVPSKAGAYSWLKAPRYNGQVVEVGALARVLVAYNLGAAPVKPAVDDLLKALGREPKDLMSVLGRHAARALEAKLLAEACSEWLEQLQPGAPTMTEVSVPETGRGYGLTEAARGALGHWIELRNTKISNYQCVVPTTWNCSPRDDKGNPGPVEQAMVGLTVADPENPIEVARVVRSFDPCIACAVH